MHHHSFPCFHVTIVITGAKTPVITIDDDNRFTRVPQISTKLRQE